MTNQQKHQVLMKKLSEEFAEKYSDEKLGTFFKHIFQSFRSTEGNNLAAEKYYAQFEVGKDILVKIENNGNAEDITILLTPKKRGLDVLVLVNEKRLRRNVVNSDFRLKATMFLNKQGRGGFPKFDMTYP